MTEQAKLSREEIADILKMIEDPKHLDLGEEYQSFLDADLPKLIAWIRQQESTVDVLTARADAAERERDALSVEVARLREALVRIVDAATFLKTSTISSDLRSFLTNLDTSCGKALAAAPPAGDVVKDAALGRSIRDIAGDDGAKATIDLLETFQRCLQGGNTEWGSRREITEAKMDDINRSIILGIKEKMRRADDAPAAGREDKTDGTL